MNVMKGHNLVVGAMMKVRQAGPTLRQVRKAMSVAPRKGGMRERMLKRFKANVAMLSECNIAEVTDRSRDCSDLSTRILIQEKIVEAKHKIRDNIWKHTHMN